MGVFGGGFWGRYFFKASSWGACYGGELWG